MTPGYALKLGVKIFSTNIGVWKIDSFTVTMFEMVLANFQVEDILNQA